MTAITLRYGKYVFATGLLLAASGAGISRAEAAAQDYRFELAGRPALSAGKDLVQVRLVHVAEVQGEPETVRGTINLDLEK